MSLIFGSMILMDSSAARAAVEPAASSCRSSLGFAAIAVFLVRLAVAAQRQPPVTGAAGMIGERRRRADRHRARSAGPRRHARRDLAGASSDEPIPEGARVRVIGVDGLTLTVRKE